ncbi:hypothetical protein CONCODRAFT_123126 [Conidiobolus coronatus NRRL 28638]|uniref:Zn(2)-C6 fungal-type domain-containing protein n=1 Tax=Conidiobolus coronatus (strain ATCC 28846 / CBS 209.66 / NRRL 28638) TaxID=796925 RepID=A0A137NWA5_CONC2|nr:hypothetical protein CONCODRAFT_123126 [Conidiobolus coronatus NRRL 28638]|eukprot:KXN66894.1 hypothetical protein CONCODRAFT_123126 [Conidiobolus coronatus NRRL 28638]
MTNSDSLITCTNASSSSNALTIPVTNKLPCLNCKKSRKKCSRTSPHCSRCIKFNLACTYQNFNGAYFFESRVDTLFDRLEVLEQYFYKLIKNFELGEVEEVEEEVFGWTKIRFTLPSGNLLDEVHPLAYWQLRINSDNGRQLTINNSYTQSSMITLPFKQLLNLYKTYLHSLYPFINLENLIKLVELQKFDNPLLIAIILRAQQFHYSLNLKKGESVPKLEDFPLYHLLITQLKIQSSGSRNITLYLTQAYAMLSFLELNEDLLVAGSIHLTQAITLGTQLNLDNWMEQMSDRDNDEKASTWLFLQYLEQFYLLCTRKPKIIKYNSLLGGIIDLKSDFINLEGTESSNESSKDDGSLLLLKMNYPKVHTLNPTTLSSNLNILVNYHHYIYFSKNLLKIKRGFNPQLVTIKEIEKLELMRVELKEIISKKFTIKTDESKAETLNLNHFKLLGFGYLLNYCLFAIILLDITELLILYYHENPKVKHKLELDQKN